MGKYVLAILILSGLTVCVSNCAGDTISDSAVGQFSATMNPNGSWSYGISSTLGGALTLLSSGTCGALQGWNSGLPTGIGDPPMIYGNLTGSTQVCGGGTVPTSFLDMHPSASGQFAVVQWTAPQGGAFTIMGSFQGLDSAPTTTDVHILLDGSSIFSGNISSFGVPLPFDLSETLKAGDTIDFAVGFGSDGNFFSDSTGLAATVSGGTSGTVPEPCSLLLLGSGLAGLLVFRRSRQM